MYSVSDGCTRRVEAGALMDACRPARSALLVVNFALWGFFIPCVSALAEIQTVIGEGEYRLGDHDTRADAIRVATDAAKRQALEQVAVYVESVTAESAGDLTRDEIRSYSAGVLTIVDQAVTTRLEGEHVVLHVMVMGTVDPDEVREAVMGLKAHDEARQQVKVLQAEVEQLHEQLDQANRTLATAVSPEQLTLATAERQALLNQVESDEALGRAWTGWALGPLRPLSVTQGYWLNAAWLYPVNPHLVVFQRVLPTALPMASSPVVLVHRPRASPGAVLKALSMPTFRVPPSSSPRLAPAPSHIAPLPFSRPLVVPPSTKNQLTPPLAGSRTFMPHAGQGHSGGGHRFSGGGHGHGGGGRR